MEFDISEIDRFFFDLDKTIWNWDKNIIGAEDLIHTINERDKEYFFHTDNTLVSRKAYAEKLAAMGIPAQEEQIITSGYVAAQKAADENLKRVYAIGEKGLIDELDKKDIEISKEAETVVAGFDRQFNYRKMRKAMEILGKGGKLYICSTENSFRKQSGERPHQEPFNKGLRTFTRKEELVGKPSQTFRDEFKDYFSFFQTSSLFIGDRLADIETGNKLGMKTAAVMSGEITREKLARAGEEQQPDFALTNLNRLKRKIL
jgi:4-nitrophenyl phosphatase